MIPGCRAARFATIVLGMMLALAGNAEVGAQAGAADGGLPPAERFDAKLDEGYEHELAGEYEEALASYGTARLLLAAIPAGPERDERDALSRVRIDACRTALDKLRVRDLIGEAESLVAIGDAKALDEARRLVESALILLPDDPVVLALEERVRVLRAALPPPVVPEEAEPETIPEDANPEPEPGTDPDTEPGKPEDVSPPEKPGPPEVHPVDPAAVWLAAARVLLRSKLPESAGSALARARELLGNDERVVELESAAARLDGMTFVPAGAFTMGSDASPDERPPHPVSLDAFYIDRDPVTCRRYADFVADQGIAWPAYWDGPSPPDQLLDRPVVMVRWEYAADYAAWAGKRLPTEAEWEMAARGADVSIQTGKVWEWTSDWYAPYPGSDYTHEDFGESFIVIRGGAWLTPTTLERTTARLGLSPDFAEDPFTGFRCAADVPPSALDTVGDPAAVPGGADWRYAIDRVAGMIYIPDGTFAMGSDGSPDEQPVHAVDIPAFYLDRAEVTCRQYARFVDAVRRTPPAYWGGWEPPEGFDDRPVVMVSRDDAAAYARWADKRLPTEAEWERAAKDEHGFLGTCLVWEWTADWYRAYPGSDFVHKDFGERFRVVRGGAWLEPTSLARATARLGLRPDFAGDPFTGFRCAADVPYPIGQGEGR